MEDARDDVEPDGEFDEVVEGVRVGVRVRVGDFDAVLDSDEVPLLLAVFEELAPLESVAVGVAVILCVDDVDSLTVDEGESVSDEVGVAVPDGDCDCEVETLGVGVVLPVLDQLAPRLKDDVGVAVPLGVTRPVSVEV